MKSLNAASRQSSTYEQAIVSQKMIKSERIKELYTVRDQLDTLKIHSKIFYWTSLEKVIIPSINLAVCFFLAFDGTVNIAFEL